MKTILTSLLTFLGFASIAQQPCISTDYTRGMMENNPRVASAIREAEAFADNYAAGIRNTQLRDTLSNEQITIPVVFHILYNTSAQNISDAQILSQLEVLNQDFSNNNTDKSNRPGAFKNLAADVRIKFCLAQVDPSNKRTSGIVRKSTSTSLFTADDAMKIESRGGSKAWNSKKYLNIWVCPMNSRTLGYATSPGSPAELDGVVISYDVFGTLGTLRANFNKGRTATHEVGHWLGMKHLWGDADCGDDGIYDTPRQKTYNFGCPSFPHVTSCSETPAGDMFMNFMDFSNDACMNMFTIGQRNKMRAFFATGGARNGFLTAFGCDSTLIQGGATSGSGSGSTSETATNSDWNAVRVYPNPVQTEMSIELKKSGVFETVEVFEMTGRPVIRQASNQTRINISTTGLKPGMYVVKVTAGGSVYSSRFIKK